MKNKEKKATDNLRRVSVMKSISLLKYKGLHEVNLSLVSSKNIRSSGKPSHDFLLNDIPPEGGLRGEIAQELKNFGLEKMANRYLNCKQNAVILYDMKDEQLKASKVVCDVKSCSCAFRKSYRLFDRYWERLQNKTNLKFVTFTKKRVQNVTQDELALFSKQIKSWIGYYKRQATVSGIDGTKKVYNYNIIKGGILAFEKVPKHDGYHLHAHMIIEARFLYKPYDNWDKVLGHKSHMDIQQINRIKDKNLKKTLSYIVKYAIKNVIVESTPQRQAQEIFNTYHKRMVRTFGSFFRIGIHRDRGTYYKIGGELYRRFQILKMVNTEDLESELSLLYRNIFSENSSSQKNNYGQNMECILEGVT